MAPSTDDNMIWEQRHSDLNVLALQLQVADTLLRREVRSPLWAHLEGFSQAIRSHTSVALVYFAGFAAILQNAPGVDATPALKQWVQTVSRERSASTIAAMAATAGCSVLEGFLRALAIDAVDQNLVTRLSPTYQRRARSGQIERLSSNIVGARNQIDTWLKPSGGAAFTEWLNTLSAVFSCSIPPVISTVLEDMIMYRHDITHPRSLPRDGAIRSIDGARISCWGLAAIALAMTLTHSLIRSTSALPTSAQKS